MKNHRNHEIGSFSSYAAPDENTISGLFAAQLQHLLSTQLLPSSKIVPDILACVKQKNSTGAIDLVVYRNLEERGLHPRILFECTTTSESKISQLFAYASNASNVIPNDIHSMLIGAMVTMRPYMAPELELYAFVKTLSEVPFQLI